MVSYDLSNLTPDLVLNLFQVYLKENNSVLEKLITNGLSYEPGTNNKYEWLESQFSPLSWSVNASSLAGAFNTAAAMTFVSTAWLKANMILYFQANTGADKGDMQVKVISVTNATTASVVIYGGTTGVALDNTCTARLISEAVKENEKNIEGDTEWQPGREYNHFQIFRKSVEISDTAINTAVYGNVSQLSEQLRGALYKIQQEMSEQTIRGRRVARSSTENGTFGGVLSYVAAAGGNIIDASSTAITPDTTNDLIAKIQEDGGIVNTVVCSINQARKFSAMNRDGSTGANAYTMISDASKDVGSFALRFISDIPLMGGIISNIVIDDKMPKDQIVLCDINKLALVPYANRSLRLVDGTQNGQDGVTAILRGEYTLIFKDSKYSAGLIKGLTL